MQNQKLNSKTKKEFQTAILEEKAKGASDFEIGQKYGVTFRYIEQLITKSQGVNISTFKIPKKAEVLHPRDFKEEQTTVWSFKQRGNWATHNGGYRGNWSPYIPRNVILKYSKPDELVLDYFCGAGTTAVETKLLGRKCIAIDINDKAIELTKKNVDFKVETQKFRVYEPKLIVGDARDLSFIKDNSIDLICAHPPYANIIHYTDFKKGDLSFYDITEFLEEISKVAKESFRILKPGRQCAILIGDMRRRKHVIPLGFKFINIYLDAGFELRELIIKRQHNCKTAGFWYDNSIKYNFLLLSHEYLPIFEKPKTPASLNIREKKVGYSSFTPTLKTKTPLLKRKLNELETTTVWILPEKSYEECLNKNVIDRYSNGKKYSTITFTLHPASKINRASRKEKDSKELLFIKTPFLINNSYSNIEFYLQKIKEVINQESSTVATGGFIVIQTQDVRIDGYIKPLAKKIVEQISSDNLWLKEIIVVTKQSQNPKVQTSTSKYLEINHQYLVVYEVLK